MKPSDPIFDDCLFELRDLMCAKGDVRIISNIMMLIIVPIMELMYPLP